MRCKPLAYTLLVSFLIAGCGDKSTPSSTSADTGTTTSGPKTVVKPAANGLKDLKIEDLKVGKGSAAATGDTIWVLYTGTLANGTKFDSTKDHENKPFGVVIGQGDVIPGWDKGLVGMKVGGRRKLSIPWKLGYGESGHEPSIPPMTDLFFDIEAVGLVKQNEQDLVQGKDVKVGSGAVAQEGKKVSIVYKLSLPGGSVVEADKKVDFTIGKDEAMVGLDQGVRGMKVGGKRILTIPPRVGLTSGNPNVPQNCPLILDVQLTKVQ